MLTVSTDILYDGVQAAREIQYQPAGWPEWREIFLRFRVAPKLNKEDGEIQVSSLIYSIGYDAERVFSQFNLSDCLLYTSDAADES